MPIYEYSCQSCSMRFEEIQKMSDPLLSECPHCGSDQVSKLVSATAFHLKGGGWYSDHYGLKPGASPAAEGGADGAAEGGGAPSSSAVTETKSAPAEAPSTPSPSTPSTPAPPASSAE